MRFNENLKELRLKKGMSQTELAEKVFVSRSAVAKWENGLGLPSDDSLNRLAEFFGVEREELYSDKATEAVIVEKNKTISKAHKRLVALGIICLTVIIALVLTIIINNIYDNVRSGTEVGKMVGVYGDIYVYDEDAECADYTRSLTDSQTPFANDYVLEEGKTYILEVMARQSGGSIQVGLDSDDITIFYDNDVFNIELISKDGEPVFSVPSYYLTVKAKCQFCSLVIGAQNFYECLIISTIEKVR
ncbi:MAG: helix-turn-helix domain-containing protein [Christensenellales bacterium]